MRAWVGATVLTIGLGGCGALGAPTGTQPAVPQNAQTAVTVRQGSPVAAISTFATAYINWSAATVTERMRRLAARSIGQARAAMQLAAAQTAGDYELRRGGIANHGQVEAVAPLRGARDRFVVVTRERTTATLTSAYQGLRPAWHVTVATVTALPDGRWVVSGWQPES